MNVQQAATPLNIPEAYDVAAQWHDTRARQCDEIALDDPRISFDVRQRASDAAKHHRASAAGLRGTAVEMRRKAACKDRAN